MRVLITGGNGFLGGSLLQHLLKNTNDDIYTIGRSGFFYPNHYPCDLLDLSKLKEVLNEIQPDIVYHLASTAIIKPNEENPSEIIRINVEGLNNLIHSLPKKCRFVFSSSVTTFGYYDKTNPPSWRSRSQPISLYGITKVACESIIRINSLQGKIHGVSVRMPALVGKNATHGLLKDLIRKVREDDVVELFGKSPGSIKPFTHVDDAAEFLYKVATYQPGFDGFDPVCVLSTKDSISVLDVANLVMNKFGKKEIRWTNESWPGDNNEIYLDPCYSPISNSKESITRVLAEYE